MIKDRIDRVKSNTKYQHVRKHLTENRDMYLVGAGCLCVGYTLGNRSAIRVDNTAAPVFNNTPVITPVIVLERLTEEGVA